MHVGRRQAARRSRAHGVWCEYPEYPAGQPRYLLGTHSALEYRSGALVDSRCDLSAWDVQANQGGLVSISCGSTGYVSVVGSTLTGISVCAHLLSTM